MAKAKIWRNEKSKMKREKWRKTNNLVMKKQHWRKLACASALGAIRLNSAACGASAKARRHAQNCSVLQRHAPRGAALALAATLCLSACAATCR